MSIKFTTRDVSGSSKPNGMGFDVCGISYLKSKGGKETTRRRQWRGDDDSGEEM
jgi:hypothetical protein